jgi:hypothetical protein
MDLVEENLSDVRWLFNSYIELWLALFFIFYTRGSACTLWALKFWQFEIHSKNNEDTLRMSNLHNYDDLLLCYADPLRALLSRIPYPNPPTFRRQVQRRQPWEISALIGNDDLKLVGSYGTRNIL